MYRNGDDYVGWHADNQPVLGEQPFIASLTFGAERQISKIFDSTAFGYRGIAVERPYRFTFDGDQDSIDQLREDKPFNNWEENLRTAFNCFGQHGEPLPRKPGCN